MFAFGAIRSAIVPYASWTVSTLLTALCASREEVKAMVEHAAATLQSLDPLCHKVARYSRAIAPRDYRWQRGN
jgi:hypothetical protein